MISIGKKVNSFSGFLDGVVNFVFRYFSDDNTAVINYTAAIDFGKFYGKWFKNFFSTEISAY